MKENIVALVTPFNEDLSVNYDKLSKLLDFHLDEKTDGILLLGTTSEAPTLTLVEKENIVKFVTKYIKDRIPIWVGISTNNLNTVKEEIDIFQNYKVQKYLIITPFYNKCNNEGMYKYFVEISKLTNRGIVIYDVESRTNNPIDIEVLKKLIMINNIVGIKECTNDFKRIIEIVKLNSDKFKVYSGDDLFIPVYASLGIFNIVSVASNVMSKTISQILESYLVDVQEGSKIYYEYQNKIKNLFIDINPIGIKTIMNYLGLDVGGFRLPLSAMDKTKEDILTSSWKE